MTEFWPEGITLDDAQSPKEILAAAQEQWRTKYNGVLGLLVEEVTSTKGHAMLVVYVKHEPSSRTAKLFTVVHRKTLPYPVTIQPREDELPNFLKKSYYVPAMGGMASIGRAITDITQRRLVENEWVADSPGEFRDQLRDAFNLGTVKASILGVVAGGDDSADSEEDSTDDGEESARSGEESKESGDE